MTRAERIVQLLTVTPEVEAFGHMVDQMEANRRKLYQVAKHTKLTEMVVYWLETFDNKETRYSYHLITKKLFDDKWLEYDMTVEDLQLTRPLGTQDWVLEKLEKIPKISDQEKTHRQDIYISFTKYLHAMTGGWFHRAYRCSCKFKDEPTLGDYYKNESEQNNVWQSVTRPGSVREVLSRP
jgi:hypothetical protein